ncbi:MAG: hypothetical protein LBU42_09595 [Prevotellaceae bacterium]|jgi:hypothetical protein|nr:hypothetical protein [Prevotellaceae bacterium]
MATLTKSQLKTLSNSTFFDNDQGEIEPSGHRAFNEDFIDSVYTDIFTGSEAPAIGFKDGDIFIKTE